MKFRQIFRIKFSIILFLAIFFLTPMMVSAAAGDIDLSFNANITGSVWAIAVQPDGKIVIGGRFTSVDGVPQHKLARLNLDGSNDTTFTSPFLADDGSSIAVRTLAVQTDGKILVGGTFRISEGLDGLKVLVRVDADGSLDPTFSAPDVFGSVIKLFFRATDNKIFCISQGNGGVSLLNSDGSFVRGIGTSIGQNFRAFVVQPDGLVVMGGVRRFLPVPDEFGLDVDDPTYAATFFRHDPPSRMELLPDGKVLVSGNFSGGVDDDETPKQIVRLNANGGVDGSFNAGNIPAVSIAGMEIQSNGKIFVGGRFRLPGEDEFQHFARLNSDGSVDQTFSVPSPDRNTNALVLAISLQLDGKILIAGDFTSIGSTPRTFIARLFNDGMAQIIMADGFE